ncbi:tyrosine-type recombinase/integrase [Mesorhizobium sp. IMUNJ 23232]|uniref:tyrosine-type recombinase/integrase n=1 Tax=Mesorhizobium sp. IMUNJ 23232 TaxID=3376064 RepID=UPI00379C0D32
MARVVTETPISTRAARSRLAPRAKPYLHGLDAGVHLGYVKGKRSGRWVVRYGTNGSDYIIATLGPADDVIDVGTLDFEAAKRAAREHVALARRQAEIEAAGPVLTVRDALETYVAIRDARDAKRKGRAVRSDASQRMHRYLLGQGKRGKSPAIEPAKIVAVPLADLTEDDLLAWRATLPAVLKTTTKRRTINDFKACLNESYDNNRRRLPATLPGIVKFGLRALSTDDPDEDHSLARENQILADGDISRLIGAAREVDAEFDWGGDLFRLILILATTGSRFAQVSKLRVADVQINAARLMMPKSKKGRGKTSGSVAIPVGRDIMQELVPIRVDRKPDEILLQRWRSEQRPGSIEWHRASRGAWQSNSEFSRPWREIVKRAGLFEVIPYALRHSSIVRMLRQNVNIRLVAALHDTSVQMIEKHYSAYIADGLEDIARAAIVPLMPAEGGAKVVRLR